MRVLCTRYDMIAVLLQTAPKVHHNYAKRIITCLQAIITVLALALIVMSLALPNVMRFAYAHRYDITRRSRS